MNVIKNTNVTAQKYLSAKELVFEIKKEFGLVVSENFVRSMMRAGVKRIGYKARLSDVMEWWEKNPDFSPRSKKASPG